MSKQPDLDDREAVALLSPLAGEPAGPSRIDAARAMAEGRRRRRTRWWSGGMAVVALTATTAAGGTLAFSALGRPAPAPPRPIASPSPSVAVAAPPTGPQDCTVTRLPTGGIEKALVTGGDPSGRWLVGRVYPPGSKQKRPLVVWRDGKIDSQIRIGGDDDSLIDVNAHGEAVGSGFNPEVRPYAYRDGKARTLAGGEGIATAINDAGVVVGALGPPDEGDPVRWASATARPQRLALPAGAESGMATDIDEEGNILGTITPKGEESTGYLWLADGTVRRMPMPDVDGRPADMFWPAAIRNGWVVGRSVVDTENARDFVYFRYRIATDRYEELAPGSGMPARVAANGWVLGDGVRPVVTTDAGRTTMLPAYPKLKGDQQYLVEAFSDDGLTVAGYSAGEDTDNQPLLWRCR
jgi:hypothetical protein